MNTSKKSMYALAIIAHPDDESFLLAGTTLKFKEEGKEVGIVCATRGEKGADRKNRKLTLAEMAKIRTSELLHACGILDCECKKFFEYPDGNLDQVDFNKLILALTHEINSCQPEIVLTFGREGVSGHKDHIIIGNAAVEACKQAAPRPREIWLASIPASEIENFNKHMDERKVHHSHFAPTELKGVADDKLLKINIEKYRNEKMAAIKAHESQYEPHLIWEYFLSYECFEVIKLPLPAGRQVD